MTRRWIVLFVVASLLAACARPAPTEPEEPSLQGELVIGLGYYPGLRDALGEVIRGFEAKHAGVTIRVKEWTQSPFDYARPVTAEMIEREFTGVDLILASYGFAGWNLHEHGYLQDLSALSRPDPDPLMAEYIQEAGKIEGEQVFIPLVLEPLMLMLNEAVFEQLGLVMPGLNWTYPDLELILRRLKAENLLSRTSLDSFLVLPAIQGAYGGRYYNFTEGRWELDTPENRAAFSLLSSWLADGLLQDSVLYLDVGYPQAAVIYTSGGRRLRGYRAVPFPLGPVRRETPVSTNLDAVLLNTTEKPELATAFLTELLSPDIGAMHFAQAGIRPVVDAPAAVALWREQVGSEWADAYEAGMIGLSHFRRPPLARFRFTTELLHAMESGTWTPELLADMDRRLNE